MFIVDKILIEVPRKYIEYANILSQKAIVKLPKYIKISNHLINLEEDKQIPYKSIYSLGLVKLEKLKTYIQNKSPK